MDGQTGLMLAFQLLALCSIAGALLLYLLCKGRETRELPGPRPRGAVLITSADTALGLQLTTHLASRGHRVFAGMRDPTDSVPAKLLRNWLKARHTEQEQSATAATSPSGTIIPLRLDVSREDLLREAADCVAGHLPAGERGVQAVVNTSGTVYRGRLENQDAAQWEAMFKTNILGYVRSARVFTQLLRPTRGRFLSIGSNFAQNPASPSACAQGEGLVVFQASRSAVEGASMALKQELQQLGIDVVVLKPDGIQAEHLFSAPKRNASAVGGGNDCDVTQYTASVLGPCGLRTVEKALSDPRPAEYYSLGEKQSAWSVRGSGYCSRKKRSQQKLPAAAPAAPEMITV